jgi:hypothetical protein
VVALDESGRPDFHRLQHFTVEASRIHSFAAGVGQPVLSNSRSSLVACAFPFFEATSSKTRP